MENPLAGLSKADVDRKLFYEGDSFRLQYLLYALGHSMTWEEIDRAIYREVEKQALGRRRGLFTSSK
jgi:hypothetical protein